MTTHRIDTPATTPPGRARAAAARAIATLATLAALAPSAWGQTIVATDINLANQAAYGVSGNCTIDASPVAVTIGTIGVAPSPICSGGSYATGPVDVSPLADGPVTIEMNDGSGPITTGVAKDTAAPSVTIGTPAAITAANAAAYTLAGTCSENTRNVDLAVTDSGAGAINASVACGATTPGEWSISGDVSTLAEGAISFAVVHADAVGNSANANAGTTKDTVLPSVAIDTPAAVTAANAAAYTLSGTCSENTRNVDLTVSDSAMNVLNVPLVCGAVTPGTFSATGDLSGFAEGAMSFAVVHADAVGNSANANAGTTKDTVLPSVAIDTPAAITAANAAAYTLAGTCSENARNVDLTVTDSGAGVINASVACGATNPGQWSISGDVSTLADGAINFAVVHTDAVGNSASANAPTTKSSAPVGQTITFDPLGGKTFGDAPFSVSATASSGLAVTFSSLTNPVCTVSGNMVTLVAAGMCTIAADQAGNAAYNPAPQVTQSFGVAQATQTITFGPLPGRPLASGSFTVSATASSGLAVTFSSLTEPVCTVSGTTVTLVATGNCTIAADQAGDTNYSAAPQVTQGFAVRAATRGDVNADLKADFFWREPAPASGLSWWTMDGASLLGSNFFDVPVEWQIADVGDLSGDGKADLVWRRTTDGAAYLWILDGLATSGFADLGILDPMTWTLVGSADFNGDGKSDLLWRDSAGQVYGWLMDGGTISSQGTISAPSTAWQVMDLADMDGNGKADIVFRNTTTGEVWVQFLDGLAIASQGSAGGLDPAAWNLAAAADFDGDGKADLLWRDTAGDTWAWIMNGTAFVSAGSLGNPGAGWTIRSVADTDGDGKSDLVWRHTDGTTYVWKMNGSSVTSYTPAPQPGGTWQIVAP